ncbi:fumarylacetoacetate hydrolase family protein [Hydrogenophaga sp. OTU3427]|uniref:fumarylacetoacetate hydrolase family protein n=1 Tax=Hydrogenophaga sp. OTU3427 TaxID=3043856 RepID=UPI00313B8A55
MKLLTFSSDTGTHPGLLIEGDTILRLDTALQQHGISGMKTMLDVIAGGEQVMKAVRALGAADHTRRSPELYVPLAAVKLCAPIPQPRKNVFCVGRNYKDHITEAAKARGKEVKLPEHVQYFTKPPTTVIGPHDDYEWDAEVTQKLDYEVELGLIIGKRGRNIPRDRALEYVFGYTVINDLTARELQKRHDQWFKGKGLDGSCPIGPWIVPANEIGDPQQLRVSLRVNGVTRQDASTSMMIFDVREIISILSQGLTLEPGDIIATGTPSGVGFAMEPPALLQDGDLVEAEVSGIGKLANRVRRIPHVIAS